MLMSSRLVFFCEFCEIFKSTIFLTPPVAAFYFVCFYFLVSFFSIPLFVIVGTEDLPALYIDFSREISFQ